MIVLAHRGVPYVAPENTLISYSIARSLGAGIEVDVRITRDQVPICIHDATLERTTDGVGLVRSRTLSEFKRLDAGGWFDGTFAKEHVPTLEETLTLFQDVPIAIEAKCPGSEYLILEVMEKTQSYDNTFVFDTVDAVGCAARVKGIDPRAKTATCCLCREDYLGLRQSGLDSTDGVWAWVYSGWLTQEQVNEMHGDGVKVYVSTLNRKEDFLRYTDYGVDGICTDHPADLLDALGMPAAEMPPSSPT